MDAPRSQLPRTLAEVEWFRVRAVRVDGVQHLSAEEVERIAAVPADANLWDDPEPVAARVRAHPLVKDVVVARRLPGTLWFRVVEREPVALLPTPTLEPVDVEGRRLPLDPARLHLDLPVLLDTTGEVGRSYIANAIPLTVVVGKDGVVKKVFVGAGPDTPKQIEAVIEEELKAE